MTVLLLALCLCGLPGSGWAALEAAPDEAMQRGIQAFQRGAYAQAAEAWTEAATRYQKDNRRQDYADTLLMLAQADQALGQYKRAFQNLHQAWKELKESDDVARQARLLNSLGEVSLLAGQREEALGYLQDGLTRSRALHDDALSSVILNNLGSLYANDAGAKTVDLAASGLSASEQTSDKPHATTQEHTVALATYDESADLAHAAQQPSIAVRARLSRATIFIRLHHLESAKKDLARAAEDVRLMGPSHDAAFAMVSIALGYDALRAATPDQAKGQKQDMVARSLRLLSEAGQLAEQIDDRRAASYAWGYLGKLYASERRNEEAMNLTRRAITLAQQAQAPEALYRWHWQDGRLLNETGRSKEAIAAYRRAVAELQSIRSELALAARRGDSTFRKSIGPLFFELADLLLQRAAQEPDPAQVQAYLREARDTAESLKAAELRDYFKDDCVDALQSKIKGLESVSTTAAIIYPIILRDRLELLVSLPGGMKRVAVPVDAAVFTQEVRTFRHLLEKRTTYQYQAQARRLYDWLIRPLLHDLVGQKITTLVFVPDGALRTIPLSALHDGDLFLIERFAVATTPGLSLTDPRPLRRDQAKLFAGGVTDSVQGFPALPNVSDELQAVQRLFGGDLLLNDRFRVSSVEQSLKEGQFNMVHIASHGNFSGDVKNTFLLAFDGKLTMDRLGQFVGLFQFRDEPLALLTLSACETAAGDDLAALGLAGVAIKAGARSAVATLWIVNDKASSLLIEEFYRQMKSDPALSKAAALQRAQMKLLADPIYRHPSYWAPFLLLNNWL